jgi:hypothetical protein
LKNGRTEEALESLKEYEGKKFKDDVANLHTYITNNRNKVDYPAYKSQSLYIGSGPIESGNKVVVQALQTIRYEMECAGNPVHADTPRYAQLCA